MTYYESVRQVAHQMKLPIGEVDRIYKGFWRAVKEYIATLPLKEDLTDEEFLKLRPNVNIPSLGKLYVTLDRYKGMKKHNEIINQLNKRHAENKED